MRTVAILPRIAGIEEAPDDPDQPDHRGLIVQRETALLALGALAQEIRLDLVTLLAAHGAEGLTAGEIAERLGIAPASLSFHFQQLMRAGLITQRRRSRNLIYAANQQMMDDLLGFLRKLWRGDQPMPDGLAIAAQSQEDLAARRRENSDHHPL